MKNKRTYLLPALLATVLLSAGCSKQENGAVPAPGNITDEIRITSAITGAGETKAPATENVALTGIHFLKVDAADKPANMTGAAAFAGQRAGNAAGAITWTKADGSTAADADIPKYDKVNNHSAFFVGCYPGPNSAEAPSKGVIGTGKIDWTIDGKTDILVSPIWSAGKYTASSNGSSAPKLTFEHQLAQLEVVLKAEAGVSSDVIAAAWGNITSISLKTYPTATYTYAAAEASAVTYSGTLVFKPLYKGNDYQQDFEAKPVPNNTNEAVDAAGMFAPSTNTIEIQIESSVGPAQTATIRLKSGDDEKDFEKGLTHKVTLTLKAKDKAIAVSGTSVKAWSGGYNGNGSIEK